MKNFKTALIVNYSNEKGQMRRTSYVVEFLSHVDGKIKFIERGDRLPNEKTSRRRRILVDTSVSEVTFKLETQRYLVKALNVPSVCIDTQLQSSPSYWRRSLE